MTATGDCLTKFLLIGLQNQRVKTDSSSLNTTHSVHYLLFIFDEHLTFSDKSHLSARQLLSCFLTMLYEFLSRLHSNLQHCHLLGM